MYGPGAIVMFKSGDLASGPGGNIEAVLERSGSCAAARAAKDATVTSEKRMVYYAAGVAFSMNGTDRK